MRRRRPVVVVGEAVLDRDTLGRVARVCPDAPVPVVDVDDERRRPGGAGLAAALLARSTPTVLVTPLGDDDDGRELRRLLEAAGVDVLALPQSGPTPVKQRVRAGGQQLCRLDRGGEAAPIGASAAAIAEVVDGAGAVLVSDYGRGLTHDRRLREVLSHRSPRTRLVWDPHPRGAVPVAGVTLATPNAEEVRGHAASTSPDGRTGGRLGELAPAADGLRRRWGAMGVAVTLGPDGALLVGPDDGPTMVPAERAVVGDSCGAGDAFAGAATRALADGALLSEAVIDAVAEAGRFVGAGAAGAYRTAPDPVVEAAVEVLDDPLGRSEAVRRAGGTVVATSGCFDLLHAGHLRLLRQARGLGDLLVVCLNSDASVRRLKGEGRPMVPVEERRELLLALDCVDEVVVFEEPTPVAVLERLRADLFVKGGDYRAADLPETTAVGRWGGQVVILPYLDDHSTSRLLAEAARVEQPNERRAVR